jgi:ankyrin repeat protein
MDQDASGRTPLMTAVILEDLDALRKFLDKVAHLNTPDSEYIL